jgi:prepilin-type processing-associated H-X9-DG protein
VTGLVENAAWTAPNCGLSSGNVRCSPSATGGCCAGTTNQPCEYAWIFGSWHTEVTNFVFLDGSVRGITDGINQATFFAIATYAAGDIIPAY